MSGWQQPTPGRDGASADSPWAEASEADPLGTRQLIRRGFRVYRSSAWHYLRVAAIPEAIRSLLALPGLLVTGLLLERVVSVIADFWGRVAANPEAYQGADSGALQSDLQTRLQAVIGPPTEMTAVSAIAGGLAVAAGLIGCAAVTAAALAAATGRPMSVAGAFRVVAARAGLVRAIVAIGIAWAAVSLLPVLLAGSDELRAWAGSPGSPRLVLIDSLLGILVMVVTIGVIVLAVRLAMCLPAILAETLGLAAGITRGMDLGRGIHVRLGQALAAILVLHAISVGVVSIAVGFAVGLSAVSASLGVAAYLVATLIGNLLWAPVIPAVLAYAYRERTGGIMTPGRRAAPGQPTT